MPSVALAKCQECARLLDAQAAAEHLVMSLVRAQSETFPSEDTRLFRLIDEALATARRDSERLSETLREHRQEHRLM